MRESSTSHFVGLDIGTSTVRCLVGMIEHDQENKLSIIGHGTAPNQGMRRGVVVHIDDVTEVVVRAVTEAERISGAHISKATVNINGSHITGFNSKGVVAISTIDREITPEDRLRAEEAATVIQLPPNREIVQFFAKNYSLDGQHNIKDPVGMHGIRLEVDAHIVTAAIPSIRNLDQALEKAQIIPAHHSVSSLATAEAVMTRQQKEAGSAVIDIGAGTTNLIVVEDGEVQHIAVIPMGGIHITNDLAIGLKTDLDIAEKVKVEHAGFHDTKTTTIKVKVNNSEHAFSIEEVRMITEARVEEILEYVDKELHKIKRSRKLPGGIVIAGGTAKLPGIDDFVKDKLQLPARVGKIHNVGGLADTVDDISYASVVGLMMLDMLLLPEQRLSSASQTAGKGAISFIEGMLRRFK